MLQLTVEGTAVLLGVKVVPGASRTRYLGEWNGRARIAVAAPPEKGKANQALIEFLAEFLKISERQVSVVTGHGSPLKTVRIADTSVNVVRAAFKSE